MNEFDIKYRDRFSKLATTNLSDAMDALGIRGATCGILPLWKDWGKILGRAVTVKIIPAGVSKPKRHLGINAITAAESGDVIVIDNAGRSDVSCWGGCLANAAQIKGISGVCIDGAARDIDECIDIGFPIYARNPVVCTARARVMEEDTNVPIQFGGVQVCPGDVIMGDRSGIVVIPWSRIDEVLEKAEKNYQKEENMVADLRAGMSMLEVDKKYNYETMLK